jgi:hypothetical protein
MVAQRVGEVSSMDKARQQVCSTLKVAGWVAALLVFALANAKAATIVVDPNATPCITPSIHFTTIQAAVNAAPSGATIHVCPANYPEQVTISQALTLRGVSSANADNPVITSPPGGVAINATTAGGYTVAAQVLVNGVGPVNINGIAVDGTNNMASTCPLVGIYYQNTSGTVDHVSVRNQRSGSACGYPIFVETTGSGSQSVTVDNSSIHDFDAVGIAACSGAAGCFGTAVSGATAPAITLTGNTITDTNDFQTTGILLHGAAGSVSGNVMSGFSNGNGISIAPNSTGSVSNNTIGEAHLGIALNDNVGIQITANKISHTDLAGIYAFATGMNNATVQGNRITGSPFGIEFNCSGTNNNVTSNTFNDVGIGLDSVPAGNTTTPNNCFNVTTKQTGGC